MKRSTLFCIFALSILFSCSKEPLRPEVESSSVETEKMVAPFDPECEGCRRHNFNDTVIVAFPPYGIYPPGLTGIPLGDSMVITVGKGTPEKRFRP